MVRPEVPGFLRMHFGNLVILHMLLLYFKYKHMFLQHICCPTLQNNYFLPLPCSYLVSFTLSFFPAPLSISQPPPVPRWAISASWAPAPLTYARVPFTILSPASLLLHQGKEGWFPSQYKHITFSSFLKTLDACFPLQSCSHLPFKEFSKSLQFPSESTLICLSLSPLHRNSSCQGPSTINSQMPSCLVHKKLMHVTVEIISFLKHHPYVVWTWLLCVYSLPPSELLFFVFCWFLLFPQTCNPL